MMRGWHSGEEGPRAVKEASFSGIRMGSTYGQQKPKPSTVQAPRSLGWGEGGTQSSSGGPVDSLRLLYGPEEMLPWTGM